MIITHKPCLAQQLTLASNGVANYEIVTSGDSKEIVAAKILQDNLKKISGADFNVTQSAKGNAIYVLTVAKAANKLSLQQKEMPGDEGVMIKILNKHIYLVGGTGNGVNNVVYEFLERYLGCRYFTSDAILIPQQKSISVSSTINYSYTPIIKFRLYLFLACIPG
jgi:hypothetical protein